MAVATGDFIIYEISDNITKVSKTSTQISLETVTNKTRYTGFDKEKPKERYISPEERQKIIDDQILIQQYIDGISKNKKFVR